MHAKYITANTSARFLLLPCTNAWLGDKFYSSYLYAFAGTEFDASCRDGTIAITLFFVKNNLDKNSKVQIS